MDIIVDTRFLMLLPHWGYGIFLVFIVFTSTPPFFCTFFAHFPMFSSQGGNISAPGKVSPYPPPPQITPNFFLAEVGYTQLRYVLQQAPCVCLILPIDQQAATPLELMVMIRVQGYHQHLVQRQCIGRLAFACMNGICRS